MSPSSLLFYLGVNKRLINLRCVRVCVCVCVCVCVWCVCVVCVCCGTVGMHHVDTLCAYLCVCTNVGLFCQKRCDNSDIFKGRKERDSNDLWDPSIVNRFVGSLNHQEFLQKWTSQCQNLYGDACGVALVSRIDKIIGLFCRRAL